MVQDEDWPTLDAMEHYGGSFVKALAAAAFKADPNNYAKLKATFPELWAKYANPMLGAKTAKDEEEE